MTENYIEKHFSDIKLYINIIEKRISDSKIHKEELIIDNNYGYVLIDDKYEVNFEL